LACEGAGLPPRLVCGGTQQHGSVRPVCGTTQVRGVQG
jgi:hypothetical protein